VTSATPEGEHGFVSRRGFIRAVAGAASGLLLTACSPEQKSVGFRPNARKTSFITPNKDFYLVAVDPSYRPPVTPANANGHWSLTLTGLDGGAKHFGYDDLSARARQRVTYTFECIGNPVGGQLIGNARWAVFPLKQFLAAAPGGLGGARAVRFEALDDFYSSVSIERATDDYAFIAMRMNGAPLSAAHGFPARVILPDLYGMKQPRWLKRVVLQESAETTSYWEEGGWGGEVPVQTMSRFDRHDDLRQDEAASLTGVAFAGRRGIRKVEVSLDDGRHWAACELVTPRAPGVWSLWRYDWQKPVRGRHTLQVRAVDGDGVLQTGRRHDAYPNGATGYDRLELTVTG
jgi:DMSO/TMAO reductase YedYZ molybdopterin-dependent catalytic subunit